MTCVSRTSSSNVQVDSRLHKVRKRINHQWQVLPMNVSAGYPGRKETADLQSWESAPLEDTKPLFPSLLTIQLINRFCWIQLHCARVLQSFSLPPTRFERLDFINFSRYLPMLRPSCWGWRTGSHTTPPCRIVALSARTFVTGISSGKNDRIELTGGSRDL